MKYDATVCVWLGKHTKIRSRDSILLNRQDLNCMRQEFQQGNHVDILFKFFLRLYQNLKKNKDWQLHVHI